MANILQILSVVPEISLGEVMVSADRRSSKTQKLSDSERIRRIVIPGQQWEGIEVTFKTQRSQALHDVLRESLRKLAGERLADALAENPLATTVDAADFEIASLLRWSTETSASRGAINFTRDQVDAWFASSATRAALMAKFASAPAKQAAAVALMKQRFGTLAAKNHGLGKIEDAQKMISLIDPADLEGDDAALVAELIGRLGRIIKNFEEKAKEATFSMDDL